jgi:hypothetical protein
MNTEVGDPALIDRLTSWSGESLKQFTQEHDGMPLRWFVL